MVWLLNKMTDSCFYGLVKLWNALIVCTADFHRMGWIRSNREKYRQRQSLSVPAFWAKNRGNRAWHTATMRCTGRWSLFTILTIKSSLISERQHEEVTLAKKKPNHHHHHCWTFRVTSLLCCTGPIPFLFFHLASITIQVMQCPFQIKVIKSRHAFTALHHLFPVVPTPPPWSCQPWLLLPWGKIQPMKPHSSSLSQKTVGWTTFMVGLRSDLSDLDIKSPTAIKTCKLTLKEMYQKAN